MSNFKKEAEKWAEKYLSSQEAKYDIKRLNEDFLDLMVFGRVEYIKDKEGKFMRATIEIMNDVGEGNTISTSEIIERYKQLLTEEEWEKLIDNE